MKRSIFLLIAASLALALGPGCINPPADHTVDKGGAMHKPGLDDPTRNCASCHGVSLEGGSGPSCTECHGKRW